MISTGWPHLRPHPEDGGRSTKGNCLGCASTGIRY